LSLSYIMLRGHSAPRVDAPTTTPSNNKMKAKDRKAQI
jgi:hypothetical protein